VYCSIQKYYFGNEIVLIVVFKSVLTMASKSVLDLFSKVVKAPHNGQPKLCMQLVKHLQLFSNEPVSHILLKIVGEIVKFT